MTTDAQVADSAADSAAPPDAPPLPTSARASIAKGYRVRLLILTLGLCGFACWALYDGYYAYPKAQAMYEDLQAFQEANDDWQSKWQAHARAQGYSDDIARNPTKLKPLETHDIATQYVMAGICAPVGLWFAYCWLAAGRRYVEADEQGVRTQGNVALSWDQVQAIEDEKWKAKGIAFLKYKDAGGADKRILLDDWKFEREPTTAIYQIAQSKLNPSEEPSAEAAEN